ncbi:MAG: type II toxin-antitoxin system HipA family toxin [Pseudomonadota bacterium]|nr:type II toxin-antitoxin system HipA family toxin [Pseudomonadota bacterium]
MSARVIKHQVDVCLGKAARPIGRLTYVKDGGREYSAFVYDEAWLTDSVRFEVSPDLPLIPGHLTRRARTKDDSCFHLAITDTEPDAWGCRVIARAHAKERKTNPTLPALTAFDYLSAVDDFSRMGALRLRDSGGEFLRTAEQGMPATAPLIELQHMYDASRAVELGQETAKDLRYLQGKGTSLGGMRPKCTVLEEDGSLALGKFPSVKDTRDVIRAEVLALRLAQRAGIDTAQARIVLIGETPVASIRRFDRTADHARIPYLSAASMLQSTRNEERAYTEVADIIRAKCARPTEEARQLWRRLVFNLLITNVDDHLQNLGFLHVDRGMWRLAPMFDVNPFPDKDRESKTWLSENLGPITSLNMLMQHADYFSLPPSAALEALAAVYSAVCTWRTVAVSSEVGLLDAELDEFAPAFEHPEMDAARGLLA